MRRLRALSTSAAPHQLRDVVHEPLRLADREGRDQDRAAAGEDAPQNRREFGLGVDPGMAAVAGGRLADEHVGAVEGLGRTHQRVVRLAEIAAEMQHAVADHEADLGGAEEAQGVARRAAQATALRASGIPRSSEASAA